MAPVDNNCHLWSFGQMGATDQKVGGSDPSERASERASVPETHREDCRDRR
jgi:hypothetical protein